MVKAGSILLLLLFCYLQSPVVRGLTLLGIRKQNATSVIEIPRNRPWLFTIYGRQLPVEGYFFTSTTHCADWNNTRIQDKLIIPLKSVWPRNKKRTLLSPRNRSRVAVLVKEGIPFTESKPEFLMCHPNILTNRREVLVVRSSEKKVEMWRCIIIVLLLLGSAICSGLNIAFFTHSVGDLLSIIEAQIDLTEKTYAEQILWYRKKSNYLICTFSAANCIFNVVVTIMTESVFVNFKDSDIVALIASTLMTVILGEIVPQVLSHRNALCIAAKTRFITLALFVIMFPFAYPLSKVIDLTLGREAREVLTQDELKLLVSHHAHQLDQEKEADILRRTVKFPEILVHESMTHINDVFSLSDTAQFTKELCLSIIERGNYTRIPVYSAKHHKSIYACVNMSDLINVPKNGMAVKEVLKLIQNQSSTELRIAQANMSLQQLSDEMKTGKYHMCVVCEYKFNRNEAIGIVTAEDVWEQLFGDIQDEADNAFVNKRAGIRKDQATLDWFHAKQTSKSTLSVNELLNIIQQVSDVCPEFKWLGFTPHSMRRLLENPKKSKQDEKIILEGKMYVVYQGKFEMLRCSNQSERTEQAEVDLQTNRKIYVFGRHVASEIVKKFQECLPCFRSSPPSPVVEFDDVLEITVLSKELCYFEIDTNGIKEAMEVLADEALDFEEKLHNPSRELLSVKRTRSSSEVLPMDQSGKSQSNDNEKAPRSSKTPVSTMWAGTPAAKTPKSIANTTENSTQTISDKKSMATQVTQISVSKTPTPSAATPMTTPVTNTPLKTPMKSVEKTPLTTPMKTPMKTPMRSSEIAKNQRS